MITIECFWFLIVILGYLGGLDTISTLTKKNSSNFPNTTQIKLWSMFPKKMPEWFRKEDNMHNNYFCFCSYSLYMITNMLYTSSIFPRCSFFCLLFSGWKKQINCCSFYMNSRPVQQTIFFVTSLNFSPLGLQSSLTEEMKHGKKHKVFLKK